MGCVLNGKTGRYAIDKQKMSIFRVICICFSIDELNVHRMGEFVCGCGCGGCEHAFREYSKRLFRTDQAVGKSCQMGQEMSYYNDFFFFRPRVLFLFFSVSLARSFSSFVCDTIKWIINQLTAGFAFNSLSMRAQLTF